MTQLTIKTPGYADWTRDIKDINLENDIELFQKEIKRDNVALKYAEIFQHAGSGEHQYVFITLYDGDYVQLDLAARGHTIWINAKSPQALGYRLVSNPRQPVAGYMLHDLFRMFTKEAAARKYNMETNSCDMFAKRMFEDLTKTGTSDDFM